MRNQSHLHKLESPVPPADFMDAAQTECVEIDEIPVGAVLEIETGHTKYLLENRGEGQVLISGHPEYCPEPVLVDFLGSVGGSAMLTMGRIEPGLKMAFEHPGFGVVRTSRVRSVREVKQGVPS
jgi:hypothetical protein